jgi:transposase
VEDIRWLPDGQSRDEKSCRTSSSRPAIGHVTWVLEVGEVERFHSVKQVISYCGLCSGEKTSADSSRRMPISKQRNRHLQTVLLEAAHLAPRLNPELAVLYEREAAQSNRN